MQKRKFKKGGLSFKGHSVHYICIYHKKKQGRVVVGCICPPFRLHKIPPPLPLPPANVILTNKAQKKKTFFNLKINWMSQFVPDKTICPSGNSQMSLNIRLPSPDNPIQTILMLIIYFTAAAKSDINPLPTSDEHSCFKNTNWYKL